MKWLATGLLLCLLTTPVLARVDDRVSAALTADTVEVKADFAGADLSLYGAVDRADVASTDLVVVVYGPKSQVSVARKKQVVGLWLDTDPVNFSDVPGYYMAASNRPLSDITTFANRRLYQLGPKHLRLRVPDQERVIEQFGLPATISTLGPLYEQYRSALIRLMNQDELYNLDPSGVTFVDGGLFRADVRLPSRAPTGEYIVSVYAFQNGVLVSKHTRTLVVNRVGIERMVYNAAHHRPWAYGVLSVLVALCLGLSSSVLAKRRWV